MPLAWPGGRRVKDRIVRFLNALDTALVPVAADERLDLYHIGRSAIHGFYANIGGAQCESELVTLRALGHEAAFFWRLTVKFGEDGGMRIEIISVMTFDDEAKIASMKAYWSQDDVTQL